MIKFYSFLVVFIALFNVAAQNEEQFYKVMLYANSSDLTRLSELGVAVDHGKFKRETFVISDFSETEMIVIKQSGIKYDVLMEDVVGYYQSRLTNNHKPHTSYTFGDPHLDRFRGGMACNGNGTNSVIDYPQPANFSLGSMGGYFTYQEYINNLDSMASKYPNLISVKAPIDSAGIPFQTHDGNPVYWVRLSDNPNTDEAEPELMYSSIHHAREPASLSQLIYYMWYLLENYGTDAEATYLLENVEMYFVPMINPDGYIYNEQTNPGGGGLWRKNRRNNGGGVYGVDLNRNYAYQYGVSGASSNTSDQTYKGPSAFSEPETRAMRAFHFDRDFRIALNAHSYGNLLLFPFGYNAVQTSDHTLYQTYSAHMVSQNGFANILSADLYPAAGDSDDWAYADDLAQKPKVLAMTPEVGDDSHGFWPATNEIIDICKSTVFMNLTAAHLTYIYGVVQDDNPMVIGSQTGYLKYNVQRLGMEAGQLDVSIAPVGVGLATVGTGNNYNLTAVLDVENDSISYTLDPSLILGQNFQFELAISNGFLTWRDTINKVYGLSNVMVADDGSNLNNWTSNSWNVTSEDAYSPSTSITDSPNNDYSNGDNNTIDLNPTIDLTNAISASISFYAKWDIEDNYDYCQLMASTNGVSWTPLCGVYTQNGTNDQDPGEPVWDGSQSSWVQEEVNLTDFLGQVVQLRFRFISDNFVTGDGFYFDDFTVSTIDGANSINEFNVEVGNAMPNPAVSYTYIPHNIKEGNAQILIHNTYGELVKSMPLDTQQHQTKVNTSNLAEGVYIYTLVGDNLRSIGKRLVVIK